MSTGVVQEVGRMSNKFRPRLESFEDRVVPASFSFRLATMEGYGPVGSGHFSTPAGYDPDAVYQEFDLDDLTVMVGGAVYTVDPGAKAEYYDGWLLEVTGTAVGPGGIVYLVGDRVSLGNSADDPSGSLALDGAETQVTFDLTASGSSTVVDRGAISYDLPYHTVDPTQANQSVALTNFKLNIAGLNLTEADLGVFDDPPMALFARGVFQGVTFTADTSALADFPYSSLSLSGLSGVAQSVGGQTFNVAAQVGTSVVTLDFSEARIGEVYNILLKFQKEDGSALNTQVIGVGATTTRPQLIQAIVDSFEGSDYKIKVVSNVVTIGLPAKEGFRKFEYEALKADDTYVRGPAYISKGGVLSVKVNGVRVDLPE
jgi:hypothetical protein